MKLMLVQFCAQCVIKFDCGWPWQVIRSLHVCLCVCAVMMMTVDSVTLGLVLTNYLLLSSL